MKFILKVLGLLMEMYLFRHPKYCVALLLLLNANGVSLSCTNNANEPGIIDEPRSCYIDNGARSLLG